MRILFTSHYAVPHVGGIEIAIDSVARELVGRGHEVTHLASAAGGEPAGDAPYRVVRVPAINLLETRVGVPWPLFSPALIGRLRQELARADVVHGHGFLYLSTVAAMRLRALTDPPPVRVLTEHVGHVEYASSILDRVQALAISSLGRTSARAANAVVVYNAKVQAELARLAPGTPTVWISNGVDTEAYRPAGEDERRRLRERFGWDDRPRALFVGRLVDKKGINLAVRAALLAGVELVVAGPGRLRDAPGSSVELLGPLPRERVAELYRAADLFLLPSRGEGFPLSVQEALASGLPAILAKDPGYAPYVREAGSALRLGEAVPEDLAKLLNELADDRSGREAAGRSAREYACREFSWARAATHHEELYKHLGAGRPAT